MRTRNLGAAGPEISVVGYGAWQAGGAQWGGPAPDGDVIAAIRAAIDSGQTWIDTAEVYGQGRSEELVGRAIAGRRDKVLLFTKVAPDDEGSGIRPAEIRSAIQGSLRRLGTDHVDLYQVHWPDDRIPVEETWGAMAELVAEGLARRIGVSNFDRALVERCLPIHPVASVQNELSLLCRDDTSELLPWLADRGIGYLAFSPLASGLLTGRIAAGETFADGDWRRDEFTPDRLAEAVPRVERLAALAARIDLTAADLALAWVLHQPGVTGAICGTLSAANARRNSAAGDIQLDPAVLAEAGELFTSGAGRPA
jgi:aryl-alcohol dehydrogenase-like predicted oxidoreductase